MRIAIEVPSNRPELVAQMRGLTLPSSFFWSIVENDGSADGNIPSMVSLRAQAALMSSESEFSVLADDNFVWKPSGFDYILSKAKQLSEFQQKSGKPGFVGMKGTLGGNYNRDAIKLPMNPMIDTGRGILYPKELRPAWSAMEAVPGGFEDHYFTSFLIRIMEAIPLKSYFSPVWHPQARPPKTEGIHDRDVWAANGMRLTGELWGDSLWRLPLSRHLRTRQVSDRSQVYHEPQPRSSFEFMRRLRKDFLEDPVLSQYVHRTKGDI